MDELLTLAQKLRISYVWLTNFYVGRITPYLRLNNSYIWLHHTQDWLTHTPLTQIRCCHVSPGEHSDSIGSPGGAPEGTKYHNRWLSPTRQSLLYFMYYLIAWLYRITICIYWSLTVYCLFHIFSFQYQVYMPEYFPHTHSVIIK